MTTTAHPPAAPPTADSRRWLALAVICVAQLMIVLDASIMNIALPAAQADLHISDASRQWALTAYTLTFGGLLLLGGRIADFVGRRRTFLVALIGFAAASALGGAAQSPAWLFSARALQGLFAALLAPAVLSLVTTTFTEARERAKAFAVYGAISAAGAAIGLIAGGALTEYATWRWTLLINTPIAVIVALASLPLLHESRVEGDRRYDIPGAILATVGLGMIVYGFTEASTHSWTSGSTLGYIIGALVLLTAFVLWEARASHPLLPLRIVLDRDRGGSYLAFFLLTMGMFAVFLFLSYYMQTVKGYSALKAGFAFLPFPAGIIVSATIASRALPKFGPRVLAPIGFVLGTTGLLWLTRLTPESSYGVHVVPSLVLISLGMGQVFISLSSTALAGVPHRDAGVASAVVNTMQQVGGSLGIAFLNTIATNTTTDYAKSHGGPSATALVHGFTTAFAVGVGIFVVGLVAVLALVRGKDHAAATELGGGEPGSAYPNEEQAEASTGAFMV